MSKTDSPVLEIRGLKIAFKQYEKGWQQTNLEVIRDLDVRVPAGEIVAVVGSSGSGKSLLAHAVLGILPYNASVSGEILYEGEPLTQKRLKKLRGDEIVLVPQSTAYLDPLMKTGVQIRKGKNDAESKEKLHRIFRDYELKQEVEEQYPFELSGGMTRRIMNSTALMGNPHLVIADEPTPGLHISVARRAMEHFRELADMGAGVLLITHDLELAIETADRIAVFYAGSTVEEVPSVSFRSCETLHHPYSQALWRAMPKHGFVPIGGTQPYAREMPQGCPFGPRCPGFTEDCTKRLEWTQLGEGRVRCTHPAMGNVWKIQASASQAVEKQESECQKV